MSDKKYPSPEKMMNILETGLNDFVFSIQVAVADEMPENTNFSDEDREEFLNLLCQHIKNKYISTDD